MPITQMTLGGESMYINSFINHHKGSHSTIRSITIHMQQITTQSLMRSILRLVLQVPFYVIKPLS